MPCFCHEEQGRAASSIHTRARPQGGRALVMLVSLLVVVTAGIYELHIAGDMGLPFTVVSQCHCSGKQNVLLFSHFSYLISLPMTGLLNSLVLFYLRLLPYSGQYKTCTLYSTYTDTHNFTPHSRSHQSSHNNLYVSYI